MKNEGKKILRAEIIIKESKIKIQIKELLDGFYSLFYFILKNPLDNFYWECISLIIQYLQLIIFIVDETVSLLTFKNIVLEYLERKKYSDRNSQNF